MAERQLLSNKDLEDEILGGILKKMERTLIEEAERADVKMQKVTSKVLWTLMRSPILSFLHAGYQCYKWIERFGLRVCRLLREDSEMLIRNIDTRSAA